MPTVATATAIVLAGGRSRRFGQDKLAADLEGVPLLHHAIRAVAAVCGEILVAAPTSGLVTALPKIPSVQVRVILDADSYEGPLVALANATPAAISDRLLLVAGDMPDLKEPLLRRLLQWGEGRDGACLVVEGRDQPLPMGLERLVAAEHAAALVDAGERSLRALMDSMELERVMEAEWRTLDPDARTLHDIDRPEDLQGLARLR